MIETPPLVKRSIEDLEGQPTPKRLKIQEGPPPLGVTMLGDGGGDEKKKGLVKEEEEVEVKVLDFGDYNEGLVSEAASQKATRLEDTGIQVHWWNDQI